MVQPISPITTPPGSPERHGLGSDLAPVVSARSPPCSRRWPNPRHERVGERQSSIWRLILNEHLARAATMIGALVVFCLPTRHNHRTHAPM